MARPNKMTPQGMICALVICGVTAYMWYEYVGPYQWFAEWQMRTSEGYSEKLTILATLLVVSLAFFVLMLPFGILRWGRQSDSSANGNRTFLRGATLAIVGLGIAIWGACKLHQLVYMESLGRTTAKDLEGGISPPSLYATATGMPIADLAVSFNHSHTSRNSREAYIPVFSDSSAPGKGSKLFIKLNEDDVSVGTARNEFTGILERNGLPGPVRTEFEKNGILAGGDYYLLTVGATPNDVKVLGVMFVCIGGFVMAMGLVMGLIDLLKAPQYPVPAKRTASRAGPNIRPGRPVTSMKTNRPGGGIR